MIGPRIKRGWFGWKWHVYYDHHCGTTEWLASFLSEEDAIWFVGVRYPEGW